MGVVIKNWPGRLTKHPFNSKENLRGTLLRAEVVERTKKGRYVVRVYGTAPANGGGRRQAPSPSVLPAASTAALNAAVANLAAAASTAAANTAAAASTAAASTPAAATTAAVGAVRPRSKTGAFVPWCRLPRRGHTEALPLPRPQY